MIILCEVEIGGNSAAATGSKFTLESKKLKESCQNGLVLSVFMLQDEMNERLVRGMLATSSIVKSWHTNMVTCCRSCEGSFEWLLQERVHGNFMKHVNSIIANLSSISAMEKCRFVCTLEAYLLFI